MANEHSRREFLKEGAIRLASIGALGYMLKPLGDVVVDLAAGSGSQGKDSSKNTHGTTLDDALEHVPQAAQDVAHKALAHDTNKKKSAEGIIDYFGAGNFAFGIGSLALKENLNILNYPATIALLGAKYNATDDAGKEHIVHELVDGWVALRVILGTTIFAEGFDFDLDGVTKEYYGRESTLEEKLTMLALISPITSSITTTVGSSTILRTEAQSLVESSVRSYAERKGLPLDAHEVVSFKKDLYADIVSHVSDNSGFNFLGDPPFIAMIQKYGVEGFKFQNKTMGPMTLYSTARFGLKLKSTMKKHGVEIDGVYTRENLELFGKVMGDTGLNGLRFLYNFFGHDDNRLASPDPRGIKVDPMASCERRITNLLQFGGDYANQLKYAIGGQGSLKDIANSINPSYVKEMLHHRVGENMADVLSVFPFQAMSIPFLQTVFEDGLRQLDNVDSEVKDALAYISIAAFSSLADNYVACKIGLNMYPENPELPLVAAIIGGSLLPPGNMANMTLASLKDYGIGDGPKRLKKHADILGIGYAYAKAIPLLANMPVLGKMYQKTGIIAALQQGAQNH